MKKVFNFGIIVIISMVFIFMTSLQGSANTVSVFDGQVTIADTANTGKVSGTDYTATVKGSLFSKKTNTITITNKTDMRGQISFGYSATSANAFTIAGAAASASGSYTATVEAGKTVVIVITSNNGLSNTTATLKLTNIAFQTMSASSKVIYEFDSSLGSVTAGGTAINSGDIVEIAQENPIEMVAKPNSGVKFLGWVDGDGLIVSRNSTYTQESLGDKTISALFSKNTPYFMVDEKYIFSNLNDAANAGNTIVLMCDGVLPAGDYTIPAGKTLLIPFDDANTLCTTTPLYEEMKTFKAPTAYRTLTLANGANIKVNGAISIGGKQSASIKSHGSPIGTYGHIAMESGSTITVNNGANLYAWGYITGSGTITAKSGATVYEDFQLRDFRGGDATSSMIGNDYGVFPMSQYYVQNIEVPLILEAGAIETGFMSVDITLAGIQTTPIPFIGPDGMFNITDGYVVKDYEETTDRLVIDVHGTLDMNSLSLSMKLSLLGTKTIDSESYTLPINGNITIKANSGSIINISQDIALLPGGVFNIEEGATCKVASNAKIFVYDKDQWGGYCAPGNQTIMPVNYAPGRKYTRKEADLVDAEVNIKGVIDASAEGAFVYTTSSGANVHGTEGGKVKINLGTDTVTYQATQGGSESKEIFYSEIPVTTALLKNADGTYTDPESTAGCNSTYIYSNEKWVPNHNFSEEWTVDIEPTCTTAGSKSHHCINCGEKSDITVIDALGHEVITHEAQAPTCEATGWNAYETCSRCDYTTYEETASLGHDKITHEAQAPTCEATGWNAYETCSRCDYTTYEEIGALGHSYGEWIAVDATNHKKVCENDGSHIITEEHKFADNFCSACGYEKAVPTIGEATGWEDIKTEISTPQDEAFIVEMNGAEEVPAEVFETIAGTKATVEFDIGNGTSWTIEGKDIPEDVDFSEINLNVELNVDTIPAEVVKTVEAEEKIQVKLAHNGEFGFTMYLNFEFGADNADKWANLYYFNTETNSLEFQESVIIDNNGVAEFAFSHASSYLATISEESATLKETATATTYSIADEKITITTALNFAVSADAQIMIAIYDSDGSLLNVAIKTQSTLEEVKFSSKDVAKIKVFVWDGFDTMKPVSLPEEVPVTANNN